MQVRIIELLSKYLLIPLLTKGAIALKNWILSLWYGWKEKKRRAKVAKANKAKAKDYEESNTVDDARDDFSELP